LPVSEIVSQPPLGADAEVIRELIHRRRQIIMHSVLYYRLDDTLISDSQFDLWSIELLLA
jgi:NAD-dependent DNA ligase